MFRLKAAAVVMVIALQGCALFSKKDKPVDISKGAPDVSMFIASVQRAIDATEDNPGWQGTTLYKTLLATCKNTREANQLAHKASCDTAYSAARSSCATLSGANVELVCADHFRHAAEQCGSEPESPPECAAAKQVSPITIKSAKLRFSAAAVQEANVGVTLKLINPSLTRKYGRTSSFEIDLIPEPRTASRNVADKDAYEMDELAALLFVALNAGASCRAKGQPAENKPLLDDKIKRVSAKSNEDTAAKGLVGMGALPTLNDLKGLYRAVDYPADYPAATCEATKTPQLILKGATYALDISYETKNGVVAGWSISSLKLVDGTVGLSSGKTVGNTLTLEIGRQ